VRRTAARHAVLRLAAVRYTIAPDLPLSNGTRLGPYEILAPIGAGGMGEVFKARDTRLERDVAIKVLPAQLAGGALTPRRAVA